MPTTITAQWKQQYYINIKQQFITINCCAIQYNIQCKLSLIRSLLGRDSECQDCMYFKKQPQLVVSTSNLMTNLQFCLEDNELLMLSVFQLKHTQNVISGRNKRALKTQFGTTARTHCISGGSRQVPCMGSMEPPPFHTRTHWRSTYYSYSNSA